MLSIEEVYDRYAKTVYRYLLSLSRKPDVAEDLTQETFYRAIRAISRFDGNVQITTWLCAIAKNQYRNYLRKQKPVAPLDIVREDAEADGNEDMTLADIAGITAKSAEDEAMQGFIESGILEKIDELGDPSREVLLLRIYGGLSFREIGETMCQCFLYT